MMHSLSLSSWPGRHRWLTPQLLFDGYRVDLLLSSSTRFVPVQEEE